MVVKIEAKTEKELLEKKDEFLKFGNFKGKRYYCSSPCPIITKKGTYVVYMYFFSLNI
jgi:hypothetical protein